MCVMYPSHCQSVYIPVCASVDGWHLYMHFPYVYECFAFALCTSITFNPYVDNLFLPSLCSNASLDNDKKHIAKECDRLKQDLRQARLEVEALQARLAAVQNTDEKVCIFPFVYCVEYHFVCIMWSAPVSTCNTMHLGTNQNCISCYLLLQIEVSLTCYVHIFYL